MIEKLEDAAHARNCYSMLEYYYVLKYDQEAQAEWEHVIDALSVQETYFWRELPQIQVLGEVLVPRWFKDHSTPLRIWSAACATGEEPYSIAIALREAGWGNHPIEIVASDASPAALAKARRATFRERSFRSLPEDLRDKYFEPAPQGWQLLPEIAAQVKFRQANLVSKTEIADMARAPIVFCRNVFIYFSPDSIRRTIAAFAALMPPRGHLFVGAAESLLKLSTTFELEEIRDAFVYVKRAAQEPVPGL
jgi:chemotaxis protein methyltransferase CheR